MEIDPFCSSITPSSSDIAAPAKAGMPTRMRLPIIYFADLTPVNF
jgi:hypothetical protein